jgi:hypothetical protein
MPYNDTWGEISSEELAEMRRTAETCRIDGMLATVDPVFHESRYKHAPVIVRDGKQLQWLGFQWAEVDIASPASRQHFIDTGRYLRPGEAQEV